MTGATGFLGKNLIDLLDQSAPDVEIHAFSRSVESARALGGRVIVHEADLLDSAAVSRAVEEASCTHLCHMGWLGAESPDRYGSTENKRWVDASEYLFDRFSSAGGERVVHVGSCIEYGNDIYGPQTEASPLESDTAYGQAKADVSQIVLDGVGHDATGAVARVFFCYGRYEQSERLVPSIISSLLAGKALDLTEGRQRRDYLDARDVGRALIALLGSDVAGAFNVGSGVSTEVRRVAEILGDAIGRPELLRFGARPEGADTAPEILADTTRIRSEVGWSPSISLEEGLHDTISFWRQAIEIER